MITESEISIYGKGLIKVQEAYCHGFLYANLKEKQEKLELSYLRKIQTVVNVK